MKIFLISIVLMLFTASGTYGSPNEKAKVVIHPSAQGWNLTADSDRSTVVISPNGVKTNVGETNYPDWVTTTLVGIKQENRKYLVIYTPPMASGGSEMTILNVTDGQISVEKKLHHHYEFGFPEITSKEECMVAIPDHEIELGRILFPKPNDQLAISIKRTFER